MDLYVASKYTRLSYMDTTDPEYSFWIEMMVSGNIDACTETISLSFDVLSMKIKPSLTSLLDSKY